MRKYVLLLSLSILFISCFKVKKEENKELISKEVNDVPNKKIEQECFKDVEEFKKFIIGQKWVNLDDEDPCHPYSQSVTIENGYIYEYNGIEPSEYKIDTILQIDSKTLDIKIKSNSNRDIVFRVEALNKEKRLVKWSYHYETTYEARPYDVICKDWNKDTEKKEPYYLDLYKTNSVVLDVDDKWKGLYYYKSNQTGIEFILDSRSDEIFLEVGGDQYGYVDQLKTVMLKDTLGLYHHKNISGRNYNDTRKYDFLKFYKSADGKFYFEGELPYLPKGAIEFEKVK